MDFLIFVPSEIASNLSIIPVLSRIYFAFLLDDPIESRYPLLCSSSKVSFTSSLTSAGVVEDAYAGIDAAVSGHMTAIAIGDAAGYDKADYKLSTFKDLLDIAK